MRQSFFDFAGDFVGGVLHLKDRETGGKEVLVLLLAVSCLAYPLVTGKISTRMGNKFLTRKDNPGLYWLSILGQVILFGALMFFAARPD